jgi:prepilin-type processing-associated H-X9-DG protein
VTNETQQPQQPTNEPASRTITLLGRQGFSPAEIGITALILVILMGIAVPTFKRFEAKGKEGRASESCMGNMKQIGLAVLAYVQDNDDTYPVCNRTYLAAGVNDASVVQASWMRHLYPYLAKTAPRETAGAPLAPAKFFFCPSTPRAEETQTIYGVGGDTATAERLPRRSIGANGLLFYLTNDSTGNAVQAVNQHDLNHTERLPVIADSSHFLWTDPRYLIFSSYVSETEPGLPMAWAKELTDKDTANPNPAYARHNGGVNLIYGDGHTEWLAQKDLGIDSTRRVEHFQLGYKLPFVPVDRVDPQTGSVTLPQDDRLR